MPRNMAAASASSVGGGRPDGVMRVIMRPLGSKMAKPRGSVPIMSKASPVSSMRTWAETKRQTPNKPPPSIDEFDTGTSLLGYGPEDTCCRAALHDLDLPQAGAAREALVCVARARRRRWPKVGATRPLAGHAAPP